MAEEPPTILIVDDVPANLDVLSEALEREGYRIQAVPSGELALQVVQRARPDLILLDIILPGLDGFETCRRLKQETATRDLPVIFLTAKEETADLVEGFRLGGVDYITKPFRTEEVLTRVNTHLTLYRRTEELRRRTEELQAEVVRRKDAEHSFQKADERLSLVFEREAERWGLAGLVGNSPTLRQVLSDITKLNEAGSRTNVLITGESGTGKELIARAVHYGGPRAKGPFVAANCCAIPAELVESVLFGHLKGAFTGAVADRKGYFEQADGGSLFLDEIADMSPALQAKLLRVLETGTVVPVGSSRERSTEVQVIAATNAGIPELIEAGEFRRDLYFRLARFTIDVAPLRERREDIPLLVDHFLGVLTGDMGMPKPSVSPEALSALERYAYPGNVRELRNLIERALIETGGGRIEPEHLHFLSAAGLSLTSVASSDHEVRRRPPRDDDRVMIYLREHGTINNSECREVLGVGMQRACYLLRKLHLAGALERHGSGRWAQYRIPGRAPEGTSPSPGTVAKR